jgi:membrane protein
MLCALKVPISWPELLTRTYREMLADNCLGLAAQLAYYFFLALFPALLFLVAIVSFVPVGVAIIYYYAPDAVQEWIWITPGSLVAAALWLVISLAFKFYVVHFTSDNATYGAIGGVIVLLLWFYVSALAVLVGAELNAEIEHASPYGKDPGEKVAGEKTISAMA